MDYISRTKSLTKRWYKYPPTILIIYLLNASEVVKIQRLFYVIIFVTVYALFYDLKEEIHSISVDKNNRLVTIELWRLAGKKVRTVKVNLSSIQIESYRVRNFYEKRETYHIRFNGSKKYSFLYRDWDYQNLDKFMEINGLFSVNE